MDIIYYQIYFVSSKYYLYCRYVLTIVDYMSKWPAAYPIFTKSAQEVASKIEDTFYRFGVCQEIISDCGGEFNNKILTELMKKNGIKHITTSPYHPQSNVPSTVKWFG